MGALIVEQVGGISGGEISKYSESVTKLHSFNERRVSLFSPKES